MVEQELGDGVTTCPACGHREIEESRKVFDLKCTGIFSTIMFCTFCKVSWSILYPISVIENIKDDGGKE